MPTLVIGDFHARPTLSYSEYIPDTRMEEMNNTMDIIAQNASDCDKVVILGDVFNSRTNTHEVIRRVTNFIERLKGKDNRIKTETNYRISFSKKDFENRNNK